MCGNTQFRHVLGFWNLELRISRIYQASHKHIMNTYLPCIMSYAKLMVCHPRLHIVGVALKWKKKKLSYNAGIRIKSQSGTLPWLWQGWDGQGPLLLQSPTTSAAAVCSYVKKCFSNLRWKYPALQGISHVSKGLQNQGCGGMPWMKC